MLKKFSLLTLFALLMMALPGCSDDIFYDSPDVEDQPEGLRINVPSVINTRAEKGTSNPKAEEMKITSLYLFAFEVNKSTEAPIIKPLSPNDGVSYKPNYKSYNLEIPNGTYKFYLVANVFNSAAPDANDYKGSNLAESIGKLQKKLETYSADMVIGSQIGTSYQGLPMTGDYTDMFTKSGDTEKSLDEAGFTFTGSANIYADLVYCVAKVTVNVEEPNGENRDIDNFSLLNYADKFPLFTSFSGDLSEVSPVTGTARVITNAKDVNDGENGEVKKTYTLYVSENTYINVTPKLSFEIGDTPFSIDLGEGTGSKKVFTRGHHYAYTVSSKGAVSMEMFKWSLEELSTEFSGPFELVLYLDGGSKIPKVATTNWTRFNFYSDAQTISIESPKFSWTDKSGKSHTEDFYDWEIDPEAGEMKVRISNKVSLAEISKLMETDANGKMVFKTAADRDAYQHIYVKANNLLKKVDIEEIEIKAEFTVTPTTNVIDLREIVATGFTTNTYAIKYASNVGNVVANWNEARWKDEDGNVIDDYDAATVQGICSVAHTTGASGSDQFTFGSFTEGNAFYNSRKTLEVTYTVEIDQNNSDEVASYNALPVKEYKVKFLVIPFTSNYIIHFKSDFGSWTAPHIYLYQCLELPSDLTGNNAANKGRTVGGSSDNAALQYCFSSGFCFKGWDGYGGPAKNDPNAAGTIQNGFFVFTNASPNYLPLSGGFYGTLNTDRYMWFGFNDAHYENLKAAQNKGKAPKCSTDHCSTTWNKAPDDATAETKTWPGIVMEQESNGWWRYELSGVAEPGKTLIMFSDGHDGDDKERFPGNNQVGVPLFDFESKEGWFLCKTNGVASPAKENYTDNRFYSENPEAAEEAKKVTYRFYWKWSDNNGGLNLYDGVNWSKGGTSWDGNETWENGGGTYYTHSNGYKVFEFKQDSSTMPTYIYPAKCGEGTSYKIKVSDMRADNEGVLSCYVTFDSNPTPGEPPALPKEPALASGWQRLMFKNDNNWANVYAHLFGGTTERTDQLLTKCDWAGAEGWWYIDVEQYKQKKAIFKNGSGWDGITQVPSSSNDEWDFSEKGDHVYIDKYGKEYTGTKPVRKKTMTRMPKVIKRR